MKLIVVTLFLIAIIFVACSGVEASSFRFGSNPDQPRVLPGASSFKRRGGAPLIKRDTILQDVEFRSSWVVEFNDLIASSPEEFGEQHNVHVRPIPGTSKYAIRQKIASFGRDSNKEDSLRLDPRISSLEFEIPRPRFPRQVPTTDPGLCNQWHLWKCPTSSSNSANINLSPAWIKNFTGAGIQIAVVDDGVQYTHPDLSAGYVAEDSYDFYDDDANPAPDLVMEEFHGTACAGLAAAQTNTYCGVGAAYKAKFAAIRLVSGDTTDSQEALALTFKPDNNDIYTNSWGPSDDGQTLDGPGPLLLDAFTNSASGRGGKGNLYTWAAGNGRNNLDQSTKDGYASNPNVIGVSAIAVTGEFASYSELGASNFICAPGGDYRGFLYTTDITSTDGYASGDCTSDFSGTSGATPIVAGALATILEANPSLTARDLRRIVGLTAFKTDPHQSEFPWFLNGAGHWISYNYGFGLISVDRAIAAAKMWTTSLPASISTPTALAAPGDTITDNCYEFNYIRNVTIEYIKVGVTIVHPFRSDLTINVTSPSGTTVTLLFAGGPDNNADINWTFYTYFFLDELSGGNWKFCVADLFPEDVGTLSSYNFKVFGRPAESFKTSVELVSVTPQNPVQGDMVEVVLTFSDKSGIFVESIDSTSILVGNQSAVAVDIISTAAQSVTAKFSFNSTFLAVGTSQIKSSQVTVQNRWLCPMKADQLLGELTIVLNPPQAPSQAPVDFPPTVSPIHNQPISAPIPAKVSEGLQLFMNYKFILYFLLFSLLNQ